MQNQYLQYATPVLELPEYEVLLLKLSGVSRCFTQPGQIPLSLQMQVARYHGAEHTICWEGRMVQKYALQTACQAR